MDAKEFLDRLDRVLDEVKVGVMATEGGDGWPHLRWMTPVILRGNSKALYAVTSASFPKIQEIQKDHKVTWMFSSRESHQVLELRGQVNVLDNPRLKSTIMEAVGTNLATFWKMSEDPSDLVCLETLFERGEYLDSSTGQRASVNLKES